MKWSFCLGLLQRQPSPGTHRGPRVTNESVSLEGLLVHFISSLLKQKFHSRLAKKYCMALMLFDNEITSVSSSFTSRRITTSLCSYYVRSKDEGARDVEYTFFLRSEHSKVHAMQSGSKIPNDESKSENVFDCTGRREERTCHIAMYCRHPLRSIDFNTR